MLGRVVASNRFVVGALFFGSVACGSFGTASVNDGGVPTSDATSDAGPPVPVCPPGTDYASRENCGVCGHDCGQGACNAGACSPYVIVKTTRSPWYLAVDGTHV